MKVALSLVVAGVVLVGAVIWIRSRGTEGGPQVDVSDSGLASSVITSSGRTERPAVTSEASSSGDTSTTEAARVSTGANGGPVVAAPPGQTLSTNDRSLVPPPPVVSAADAEDVVALDRVRMSLRDFRTITGENPTGTNEEIAAALNGGNRKQARLLPPGVNLNGKGQLVDRWSTPYFFHQISSTDMEIRSAGPDRILWTTDDIVTH